MTNLEELKKLKIASHNFGIYKKGILNKILSKTIPQSHQDKFDSYDYIFSWGFDHKIMIKNSCKIIFVEDGFIRSFGLGAEATKPISWVFDDKGIYFNSKSSSKLEIILSKIELNLAEVSRIKKIHDQILVGNLTKYNLRKKADKNEYDSKNILVLGQVNDDLSIKYGSVKIKNNIELLQEVRSDFPNKIILYKPHPDYEAGLREGYESQQEVLKYADSVLDNTSITDAFKTSDSVVVNTSLGGFEALMRYKKVFCYGNPFYSGWGLTIDKYNNNIKTRRLRKLSLNELMYGALIKYPSYFHPSTFKIIEIEEALEIILKQINDQKFNLHMWPNLKKLSIFLKKWK